MTANTEPRLVDAGKLAKRLDDRHEWLGKLLAESKGGVPTEALFFEQDGVRIASGFLGRLIEDAPNASRLVDADALRERLETEDALREELRLKNEDHPPSRDAASFTQIGLRFAVNEIDALLSEPANTPTPAAQSPWASLIAARESVGMSRYLLAQKMRINLSHLGRLERGDATPRTDTVRRAAEVIGVPVSQILPSADVPITSADQVRALVREEVAAELKRRGI